MEHQINLNAFNVHNEIVSLYKANQIVLEYDDATKKLMYLVDNIDNLSLQSVKHFIKKQDSLFDPESELIQDMDNLYDAAKALLGNKVFKNPAMQGILTKQLMTLQKEYNKLLILLVLPIYQKIGEGDHIEEIENEDIEDIQESSPENESGQDTENEIQE